MKVGLELDGGAGGAAIEVLLRERLGQLRKLVRVHERVDDHLADARDGLVPLELAVAEAIVDGALHRLELREGHACVHVGHRAVRGGGVAACRVRAPRGVLAEPLLSRCARSQTL